VTVTVTDKKEADAINKLSRIDAQFTATPYYIDVQTVFKDNKTALNADISEITSSIFNSQRNVAINYSVTLPEWAGMEINNKYGNVYMDSHSGKFTLDLSNGDFKGTDLLGENDVTVTFGNITLNKFSGGKLNIGYSEMTLKQGEKLKMESRSSKFWLTSVNSLEIDSKRDKFFIDTLTSLTGQSDFSTLQVNLLKDMMTMKTNYGDLKANQMGQTFRSISLNAQYTDIIIGIPAQSSFSFTADYKKTAVDLPASFKNLQPQLIDEKSQQYKITGIVGSEPVPSANIRINAVSGSITFVNY